jgi:hypothetical protein
MVFGHTLSDRKSELDKIKWSIKEIYCNLTIDQGRCTANINKLVMNISILKKEILDINNNINLLEMDKDDKLNSLLLAIK